MKIIPRHLPSGGRVLRKRKQALLAIILLYAFLGPICSIFAQETKIDITVSRGTNLREILELIKNRSMVEIFYDSSLIEKSKANFPNQTNFSGAVSDILQAVLKGSGFTFNKQADKFIVVPIGIHSQRSRSITGKITNRDGTPIDGATISILENKKQTTSSDKLGNFALNVDSGDRTLQIRSVGFQPIEIAIGDDDEVRVTLNAEVGSLEEVVVVGYGTQKRANITGSVSQVKGDDLRRSPVANVSNALIGRLPGLRATQRSGQPGADGSGIDIRGFGNALVIVDGVPGSFSQLDPSEIESLSVVKDASASVYGVRAANGVILVTTKRGRDGKPSINYSTYYGFQTINRFPELGDAKLYASLSNEAAMNAWHISGRTAPLSLPFSEQQVQDFSSGAAPSYNWFNEAIRKSSPQSYHNINVSGGTVDVRYFMNLGMIDQQGMWRSEATDFKRYNVRTNLEAKVASGLTASLNLMGRKGNVNNPATSTPLLMAGLYRTFPTFPFYANGNNNYPAIHNNAAQNTLALMDNAIAGYNRQQNSVFNGIFSLQYDIPKVSGLYAKATYSYNYEAINKKIYNKKYDLYRYNSDSDTYEVGFTGNTPSDLSQSTTKIENNTFQLSLNYKKSFESGHDLDAMLLMESQQGNLDSLSAYRQFLLDGVDELFAGVGQNQSNSGLSNETARLGYIGKFNYAYRGKYLAEFAFRYDGTFKVKEGSRYGFFPNFSLGWDISKESFLKAGYLDQFKIRFSHGKAGDDEFITAFQYLTGYTYPAANWVFGDNAIPGLINRGLINENLTWYMAQTTNLGLDFSIWKGLIAAEIDIFYRSRSGLLANRLLSLPNTFGAVLPQENLNSDNNRGFEIALSHKNKIGALRYTVSPNLSWTRRRADYIERAPSTNLVHNWRNNYSNRWDNLYWGHHAIGQFQNQQEINEAPVHDNQANKTILPGDIRYEDLNGDGVIDDRDTKVIGRGATPELFYGMSLSLNFKGFDLAILLQGASNFNAYFSDELQNPLFNNASAYRMFEDRWQRSDPYNADSEWIQGKYPSTIVSGSLNNKRVSSFWLKDATYLRVKNIEFGYNVDAGKLERLKLKTIRLYISGQNILTFDKINYIDPEAPSGRGNYYPQQRVWTAGLNLGF